MSAKIEFETQTSENSRLDDCYCKILLDVMMRDTQEAEFSKLIHAVLNKFPKCDQCQ